MSNISSIQIGQKKIDIGKTVIYANSVKSKYHNDDQNKDYDTDENDNSQKDEHYS